MVTARKIVREARVEDLGQILRLLYQLSPPGPGGETDRETGSPLIARLIGNPDYCLCVAELDGESVGTATLLVQLNLSHGGKPCAHLENVVTDRRFRGKGIGREMVGFLVAKARESGCYKVILNCEAKNIPFYKRCGFRTTGEAEMRLTP